MKELIKAIKDLLLIELRFDSKEDKRLSTLIASNTCVTVL